MTPGNPSTIYSLRTEHYGAFAIALIAHIICIRHTITETTGYLLNCYIDNDAVIKRLKYGILSDMGASKYCNTDFNIRAETVKFVGGNGGFDVSSPKSKLSTVPAYRKAFADGYNIDDGGLFRFNLPIGNISPRPPLGTAYEGTSFAYRHKNALFITVDAFSSC